jgi:hypothetical protein
MSELVVFNETAVTEVKPRGSNYLIGYGGREARLIRDEDFGKVGKSKKPSLFKSGAEKVLFVHGLLERYTLEEAHECFEGDNVFFFYRFRCDLVAARDGIELVVKSGWGSANTREGRAGMQSPWDGANSAIKMAKKRAMVDAAVSVGRLSGMFTQDIENDDFMEKADKLTADGGPDSPITSKQVKMLFAIAKTNGIGTEQAKAVIAAAGYTSSKDVLQKDFDAVCEAIKKAGKA